MQTLDNPFERRHNRGYNSANEDDLDLERRELQRRSTYRLPLRLWTEGRSDGRLDFHNCSNVSEIGMFVETPETYALNELVDIEFNLPNIPDPIRVQGRVVSVIDDQAPGENIMGNGFVFESISRADQKVIRSFIEARNETAP